MKKNLIFLVVDALRYDRIATLGYKYKITPNLDKICKEGFSANNHFANGCPTDMSFPSIFSSTYSLDFGGFNSGIKNRPSTLAEVLKKNNYQTFGITTAHPSSSHFGYNRGFDHYENLLDLYQWFRQNLKIFLREPLRNFQNNKITEKEIITILSKEYKSVLISTLNYIDELKNYNLKKNKWNLPVLKKNVLDEIAILDLEPKIILEKFLKYDYWYYLYLGKKNVPKIQFIFHSLKENLREKVNSFINLFPRRRIYNAQQVFDRFNEILKVKENKEKPFFFFLHVFDIHESKNLFINFSFSFLYRLIKLLIIRKFKFGGLVYDLSLMYFDHQLGLFIKKLKNRKLLENSIFIVTSDHGLTAGFPERPAVEKGDISRYLYDEFIKVPFIIYPYTKVRPSKNYLTSHLDLSPTILELLSIDEDKAFKGKSIFANGIRDPDVIYAESNGSGRCDLQNKPIYICIRSKILKVVYKIEKNNISERDVYSLEDDPNEMTNLTNTNTLKEERNIFFELVKIRIKEIFNY